MGGVPTDKQIPGYEEYRAAFNLFDRNNDGCITSDELEQAIRSLGKNPQQQEICDMIAEFDANGNGTMEFQEFYDFMTREMEESEAEEARRAAFNACDSDRDGFITACETDPTPSGEYHEKKERKRKCDAEASDDQTPCGVV